MHTFPGQVGEDERSHRGSLPAHTAPGRCLVALMHSVSNQLHLALLEQFWDQARDPKSNTPFIWCKQCPLCPSPALTVCLPCGRVVISHTAVTQLVLLLWLDNTEQLQESSHEDEDKENKAVFKSVTSVIILEGGWEGKTALSQSSNNPSMGTVMLQRSTFNRKAYFTFPRKACFTSKFL